MEYSHEICLDLNCKECLSIFQNLEPPLGKDLVRRIRGYLKENWKVVSITPYWIDIGGIISGYTDAEVIPFVDDY